MLSHWFVAAVVSVQLGAAPSPQAKAKFDLGEQKLAAGQLDDAAAAYREAVSLSPGYADALTGLGSVLFKQGKREDGIAQFKAAIAADPNFKLAYFNLGYACRKTGDFATAAQAYEKYTKLDPSDPDGFYGLGESYRQSGQPQQAIAAYQQYLTREKRPSEQKWIDRAKGYIAELKTQKPPEATQPAITPSTTAATTATTPPSPTATITQPQPQSVGAAPGQALPSLAQRKVAEGDQLYQQKRYREASFAYQDATNADPQNIEALFKLGNAYAVLGYYSQAIDRWNRVDQLSPDPSVRKSAEDNVARAREKIAQAQASSPQAAGEAPGSGPVADSTRSQARQAYERGVQQVNARDFAGAVQSLTQAIQLEPTLAVAYVARGSANIGLRRYGEAVNDYQYALRIDPSMGSPLYGIAEAYRALGRNADARQYFQRYVASTASDVRPELQNEARQKADRLAAQPR